MSKNRKGPSLSVIAVSLATKQSRGTQQCR
jgi:hypothetical protein